MTNIERRSVIGRLGFAAATLLAGSRCGDGTTTSPTLSADAGATTNGSTGGSTTAPANLSCVLTPALTEGPFYFDAGQIRLDITEGRPGASLVLALGVVDASTCEPIRDAVVDIWHCDATGLYSGYGSENTAGQDFLRGIQVTDANGEVEFQTIYPGFYRGRTIHVHMKVHLDERTVVTSQFFFPEGVNDEVLAMSPYNLSGVRDTRNVSDGIFTAANVVDVTDAGDGYRAGLVIGVVS